MSVPTPLLSYVSAGESWAGIASSIDATERFDVEVWTPGQESMLEDNFS